jgi:nucleotide-binding universal stress UspA family protein
MEPALDFSKGIVAATDFSEGADNAARRAAMLASTHKASLHLLHVLSATGLAAVREWLRDPVDIAERLVADANGLLRERAASIDAQARIGITPQVVVGGVDEEIRAGCATRALLVVGGHGANTLGDLLLGTTAERVVRDCEGPVLVVRQPPREPYRNVLVGIDLLPGSDALLAGALAIAPDARLTVVHAYDVAFEGTLQRAGVAPREVDRHRSEALARAMAGIRAASVAAGADPDRVLALTERGDPARLIVEHGRSIGADLVVVARRSRSALQALLIGSVARRVATEADRDVLVLRAQAAAG